MGANRQTLCRPSVVNVLVASSLFTAALVLVLTMLFLSRELNLTNRQAAQDNPQNIRKGATSAASCLGRCNDKEDSSYNCQCNSVCKKFSDCCSDYDQYCTTGTCLNRCSDVDPRYPCTCDDKCGSYPFAECCSDYDAQCKVVVTTKAPDNTGSCSGRCGNQDSTKPCQCNSYCTKYGDCCSDYASLCINPIPLPTSSPVIPADMSAFATAIWADDVNRIDIGSDMVMNMGNYISNSYNEQDVSPSSLFTSVNTQVFQRPTYKALIKLFNNYITSQGNTETKTSTEVAEEDEFMNAIFNTVVMQRAYQFVKAKNYFSGTLTQYKDLIRGLLFTHYTRQGKSDSSGFEHVFVGEWSSGSSVSGFHNWVRMYLLEEQSHINYHGYMKKRQPNIIKCQFKWTNRVKPSTSIMYGVSPEFEVALFSTCFLKSRNTVCKVSINGQSANIQTYDYKGAQVFGSAYFIA